MSAGDATPSGPRRDGNDQPQDQTEPYQRNSPPIGSPRSNGVVIGTLAGVRVSLSYSVFIGAIFLVVVTSVAAGQPNNADLPHAVMLGIVFWVSGWMVQAVVHLGLLRLLKDRTPTMLIGLVGVESAPRKWPAGQALIVSVTTVAAVLALGMLYRFIEGGFQWPVLNRSSPDLWIAPGLGTGNRESLWKTGAWLCWVQAIFQMYPLPRMLGRQIFAALASLTAAQLDLNAQVLLFRRCLIAIAMLTLLLAMTMISSDTPWMFPRWLILTVLSLLLWLSARRSDIPLMMDGFQAGFGQRRRPNLAIYKRLHAFFRRRRNRIRATQAMYRERSEAIDTTRLDEILQRLHTEGPESLTASDRKVLERVSNNLRRQRQNQQARSHEPEAND